ncbi:MAG: hypothetical protein AW10_02392 [Candidatus Accumulibacter appositus]|uniref:Uncharacterized protein n=1 Tax=Candidatus Accumulibacter appositus TaxID=1454003 RepID=A0A011PQT5_9PROT|nr:MAG: hypothetical protein AW10_02392 [Candidatus Accumulibacter appositus]
MGLRALDVAQYPRRDREHDLGLDSLGTMAAEQSTKHRNIAQEGHLVGRAPVFVADQTGEQLVLAVLETEDAGRRARADAIGDGSRFGLHLVNDVADLESHLDGHFVVQVDRRFDVQLEADIDVGDRLGDKTCRGSRRGDVRHALADQNLGFLAVAGANPRVGQQVDVGIELVGTNDDRTDGGTDGRGVEIAQIVQGQLATIGRRQRRQRQGVRPVDPQLAKTGTLDL